MQDETAFACLLSSSATCQDLLADLSCMSYVHHTTLHLSLCHQQLIINQYINNGSDVYSCLLDASKDFDRIHYGKLFRILLSTKLPILIIRWILDSYLRQSVCEMWDSCKSEYSKMYNGVKQDGVISCHLF